MRRGGACPGEVPVAVDTWLVAQKDGCAEVTRRRVSQSSAWFGDAGDPPAGGMAEGPPVADCPSGERLGPRRHARVFRGDDLPMGLERSVNRRWGSALAPHFCRCL